MAAAATQTTLWDLAGSPGMHESKCEGTPVSLELAPGLALTK
jgi:hypothetical protein